VGWLKQIAFLIEARTWLMACILISGSARGLEQQWSSDAVDQRSRESVIIFVPLPVGHPLTLTLAALIHTIRPCITDRNAVV